MSKQLRFNERTVFEGDEHPTPLKDNGATLLDFIFAGFILMIIITSAFALGLWISVRNTHTLPETGIVSRRVNVELNGQDTVRVTVTDKFIYHYNALTDEQKEELRKEIK